MTRHWGTASAILLGWLSIVASGCTVGDQVDPRDSDTMAPTGDTLAETDAQDTESALDVGPGPVLLIVLDDIGIDQLNPYRAQLGLTEDGPPTPNMDGLADEGLMFLHAWGAPTCSPMRASLLTGKHSFRTGVGAAVAGRLGTLAGSEVTLAEQVGGVSTTGLIGKWHLGNLRLASADNAPIAQGFDTFHGSLGGAVEDYWSWSEVHDISEATNNTEYALSWKIDRAIEWIEARDDADPWVLYLALNSAHTPLHAPPTDLHDATLAVEAGATCERPDERACFDAMIRATDTELGRLLSAVDDRVTVVLVGDNGTSRRLIAEPFSDDHSKGTIYEGGVRVPLVVKGPSVSRVGEVEAGLVQTLDLFATIVELVGADLPRDIDAESLMPLLRGDAGAAGRDMLLAERFVDGDTSAADVSARDGQYLVVMPNDGPTECYDLGTDPDSQNDLAGASAPPQCAVLEARAAALRGM